MRVIYRMLVLCAVVASYEAAFSTDSLIEMIKKNSKSDNVEPLVLTISSSVWHLLDTKQDTISKTMSSISFPEINGKISKFQYKVSDAKIEMFSLPSNGISFQKYDHGVYLKIKGVQFKASAKAKVGLVKKNCLLCLPLPSLKGGIIVTSQNVSLNVELVWHDYKFTPKISMESNIKLKFTGALKILNIVTEFVDIKALLKDKIENLIDKNIVNKLDEGVNSLGNPHLQQLKAKVSSAGYKFLFESPIQWTVRNNNLRISVKLDRRNLLDFNGIQDFLHKRCLPWLDCPRSLNISMLPWVPEEGPCYAAEAFAKKLTVIQAILAQLTRIQASGLVINCVQPELNCQGSTCSVCTDFNITRSSSSSKDQYHNCIPKINFMDWLKKNFGQYLTSKNVQKKMISWFEKNADDLGRNADLLIDSLFDF